MEIADFEPLINLVPRISATRKYWLVRTQSGLYYEDYKHNNFIAVGYNPIRLEDIVESKKRVPNHPENFLAVGIRDRIKDEKQPRYVAKQLLKFVYDIKKGDIVIIPSESSRTISIGEVVEDHVYLDIDAPNTTVPKGESKKCPFIKRRKVRWYQEVKRNQLDPLLYKLLFSHHIISDGSAYDNIVDNMLHDLYIKNHVTYLVLDVATTRDIEARTLFDTGSSLLNLVDEYQEEFETIKLNSSRIDVKLALRSPGKIQLSGKQATSILIIGLGVLFLNGGDLKSDLLGLELHTSAFLKNIDQLLTNQHKRQMRERLLEENIKRLQLKNPEDLKKVMNALEINENNSENKDVDKSQN